MNLHYIKYILSTNYIMNNNNIKKDIKKDINEIQNNGLENDDWLGDR